MTKCHGIDSEEWTWRVGFIMERMMKEGRWTEEDAKRKVWIYEQEVNEFVYRPGELSEREASLIFARK